MTLLHWLATLALLAHAVRSAVDIAFDKVKEEGPKRLLIAAGSLAVVALMWMVFAPDQAPVGVTMMLAAGGLAGRAWCVREIPTETLPPVRY